MPNSLDRRSFLKIMSLLPLLPALSGEQRAAPAPAARQADGGVPNVILLLFDTLSARHLSLHGYRRETTPHLAHFAQRATVYHRHYSAGNFTTPGTASLLTGVYPWTHRALHHRGIVTREYAPRNLVSLLTETHMPILYPHNLWADLLVHQFLRDGDVYLPPDEFCLGDLTFPDGWLTRDADIASRSFEDLLFRRISLPGSLFLSLANKLQIQSYTEINLHDLADLYPRGVPTLGTYPVFFLLEQVIDGIKTMLDGARQPFLAYLHLFPPHEPYCPRREFVGLFADGWAPVAKPLHPLGAGQPQVALDRWRTEYDEYVAYTDAEFGRFVDFLDGAGLLDNSCLVVTSDHGQLFERGVHGHDTELLYEPVIHVPLLISRPGQQQREDVYTPTSCVDLLPTLLDTLGRPIPAWCEGQVLPRENDAGVDERSIYSVEAKRNAAYLPLHTGTIALIRDRYKLIHYLGDPGFEDTFELYDLANDPEELDNLYTSRRSIAGDLQEELEAKLREVNQPYISQR